MTKYLIDAGTNAHSVVLRRGCLTKEQIKIHAYLLEKGVSKAFVAILEHGDLKTLTSLVESNKCTSAVVTKCGGPLSLSGPILTMASLGKSYAEKILYLKDQGFDVKRLLTSKALTDVMICVLRKGTQIQLKKLLELGGSVDSSWKMLMKCPSLTSDEVKQKLHLIFKM